MQDMRYLKDEGRFLESAWDVYRDYFTSRTNFLSQYGQLPSAERKNLFLMIISGYKLLVRDGEYRLVENWQSLYLDYLDHTYKFISIMSLIEALFADEEHVDFYQWLTMKKRRKQIFPIADTVTLDRLYREYKIQHGARKAVRFFSELDEGAQNYLATRIKIDNHRKPAEVVARKLYIIRSEFVHQGRLILEFSDGQMFSKREGAVMYSTLSIRDLQLLFEHGILYHFHLTPDLRKI
jgi:hypothetical protein